MPELQESSFIEGVYTVQLKEFGDDRGRFMEVFRKEWFAEREWNAIQSNRSDSAAGVLRGLHYHHKQVDYWHVIRGRIRAGLVDLRRTSTSFKESEIVDLRAEDNLGLYIPVGVAHGFAAITPVTLFYIVDNYYDGEDEYGIVWNDPEIGLEWGLSNPMISKRDRNNPLLKDIPHSQLPK
jgi:dTDP-4-dehydrorhamnose 3,5-epimerase